MKITDEMVNYIATLARLTIKDEERETTKIELEKFINYMDILEEVDTTSVEEMSHAFAIKNNFREDIVVPSVDREKILSNAPEQKDGCFKVPKAVD